MFLVVQSSYDCIEIGLFENQRCLIKEKIKKINSSKELIPVINELLIKKNIQLKDLAFIAANQGPAPFTTLRVVLATINGIAFACPTIALIAVNALTTYLQFTKNNYESSVYCILFYAYGNEFYYAFSSPGKEDVIGCSSIENISALINEQPCLIAGNGIEYARTVLQSHQHLKLLNEEKYPSLETIAAQAQRQAEEKITERKIIPLYLKLALH